MLKLPNGCARLTHGARRIPRMISPLLTIAPLPERFRIQPPCKLLESLGGQVGMDDMKMGVRRQGAMQVVLRLRSVAEVLMDHPSMKEQAGVSGAQFQRLGHGGECLLRATILIQG